jgi:hypothetical protein
MIEELLESALGRIMKPSTTIDSIEAYAPIEQSLARTVAESWNLREWNINCGTYPQV